jgi:hypothetical protein
MAGRRKRPQYPWVQRPCGTLRSTSDRVCSPARQPDAGVYARDQASLPAPTEKDHPLAGVATFLFEMGHLKHLTRSGWRLLAIAQPEPSPSTLSALAS